jgi:hypothetical protein
MTEKKPWRKPELKKLPIAETWFGGASADDGDGPGLS